VCEPLVDDGVDGAQGGTQFGGCVGLVVGGEQWGEDSVVDLGVEDGEWQSVRGEEVLVACGDAGDQALAVLATPSALPVRAYPRPPRSSAARSPSHASTSVAGAIRRGPR